MRGNRETNLRRASFLFAQWLLMTLENSHEAALPIPEISGRLKIFIECCWILGVIDRHGLVPRFRRGRLILSSRLETDE